MDHQLVKFREEKQKKIFLNLKIQFYYRSCMGHAHF